MSTDSEQVTTPAPPPRRRRFDTGTFALVGPPVIWLVAFFIVPVLIAGAFSVGVLAFFRDEAAFSLDAWIDFLNGSAYLDLFWKSARMSLIVSIISVLLVPNIGCPLDRVRPQGRKSVCDQATCAYIRS